MNKTRHKRQKYKYHSRKAFNHKKHAKIRKSAKNKQPTNLLFKTVKLYKKQKNKYLDKQNSKPIRVKKQKGGYKPTNNDIDVLENSTLTPQEIIELVDILHMNNKTDAISKLKTLSIDANIRNIIERYLKEENPKEPEGDNKLAFLKVLAQKIGLNAEKIRDDDIENTIATKIQEIKNDPQFKKKMTDAHQERIKKAEASGNQPHKQQPQQSGEDDDTTHAAAVAAQHDLDHQSAEKMVAKEDADVKQPIVTAKVVHDEGGGRGGGGNDDDTSREKTRKQIKEDSDIRKAEFEKQDEDRRKFASEKQVLNRLQRDLKQHNVSTKIFKDPTKLKTLFTFEINTFDDLVNKNNSTIREIMNQMNLNSTEKEKLLNLIKKYKNKKTNNTNDNENDKKPRQKTANVSKLLKEIDDYKIKLANIQLKMKEMQSKKGDRVCFDTTTPDIVKETGKGKGKGKGKVEKGTTVRICVESKNNVKEWAKSVAKGKKDKVITGNTLDVSSKTV